MEITIKINVDQSESAQLAAVVTNSKEFYNAVWELNANMHNTFKHHDWSEEQEKVYEEVRKWLFDDVFDRCVRIVMACEP